MVEMNKSLLFLSFVFLFITGCSSDPQIDGNTIIGSDVDKLEIFHFHGYNQCYSCKTMGAYAEETVKTYFVDKLESGKIVFGHINAELPENRDLAVKYGVTGSSLWLGTYTADGKFIAEQNTNVWYKINSKLEYTMYLKEIIEQKLAGN